MFQPTDNAIASAASAARLSLVVTPAPAGARKRPGRPEVLSVADEAGLLKLLQRELVASRRCGAEPALLLITIQGLSSHGQQLVTPAHLNGARHALGERLRGRVRSHDVVVRLDASQYAVILGNMAQARPELVQQRLQQQLAGTYEIEGQCVSLSLRMASACGERQRLSAAELLALAQGRLQGQ